MIGIGTLLDIFSVLWLVVYLRSMGDMFFIVDDYYHLLITQPAS